MMLYSACVKCSLIYLQYVSSSLLLDGEFVKSRVTEPSVRMSQSEHSPWKAIGLLGVLGERQVEQTVLALNWL